MALVEFNNDSTPYLNAENLNANFNELKGVLLYNNPSGSNNSITLNDNLSNYSYIEIFYNAENRYNSQKIPNPNGKSVSTCVAIVFGINIYYKNAEWKLTENNINFLSGDSYAVQTTTAVPQGSVFDWQSNTKEVYITQVIGYK